MKSTTNYSFSAVPTADIQRSTFDRSHGFKTTLDSGYLVPCFIDEALPADTFNLNMTGFARMATPIRPIMDNLFMDTHFFAVPVRLLWENWEAFNGAQTDPDDSTDFLIPSMTSPSGGYDVGTISDYFGIPTGVENLEHSALFHRAYNLIYNEWFRDENLQDSVTVNVDDGPDSPTDYSLLRRGKRHDYFTSSLPWPQKGDAVSLPLGVSAPIAGLGVSASSSLPPVRSYDSTVGNETRRAFIWNDLEADTSLFVASDDNSNPEVYADLTQATAATINSLRQAFQVQRMLERDARGGTRYTEVLKSHFGVTSPDARLQRPEYLGGGSSPIVVNAVQQTSSTDDTSPQGNLAAVGTAAFSGHGFNKSFTEHSIILGFVSVRADLTYQQGLNRMFSRQTRYDFFWPALAHLGEQAVLNKEIFAQGTDEDNEVFGYQERFAEYRYKPSLVTGLFRSQSNSGLDTWHLAQDFDSLPTLSSTFIEENPPVDRVIAVPSEPQFILDTYFKLKCARPMPTYSVPGLIDHF